jgi:hypothetical protein
MKSLLGRSDLPRGLRNNNPGNLIITANAWQGKIPVDQNTDGHFEQFRELRWGIRAMLKDIIHDIRGGRNTLTSLINEYAPPHENDTAGYIAFVSNLTGLLPDSAIVINRPVLTGLVLAKMKMENGTGPVNANVTAQDISDAFDVLGETIPGEIPGFSDLKKKADSSSLPLAS